MFEAGRQLFEAVTVLNAGIAWVEAVPLTSNHEEAKVCLVWKTTEVLRWTLSIYMVRTAFFFRCWTFQMSGHASHQNRDLDMTEISIQVDHDKKVLCSIRNDTS